MCLTEEKLMETLFKEICGKFREQRKNLRHSWTATVGSHYYISAQRKREEPTTAVPDESWSCDVDKESTLYFFLPSHAWALHSLNPRRTKEPKCSALIRLLPRAQRSRYRMKRERREQNFITRIFFYSFLHSAFIFVFYLDEFFHPQRVLISYIIMGWCQVSHIAI